MGSRTVRAVVFDVGETIISEERIWSRWAERLGVRPLDFFAVLGAIVESDGHHRDVFEVFAPGFDVDAAMAEQPPGPSGPSERATPGPSGPSERATPGFGAFDADDLYPDARPCLEALRADGLVVGLAGNQPEAAEAALHEIGLEVDFVAASARWGVEKPSPEFFARVAEAAGVEPAGVAYVGDRLDNDVLPAKAAGMVAVFLRRGPWGWVHARRPEVEQADLRLSSLDELPAALRTVR